MTTDAQPKSAFVSRFTPMVSCTPHPRCSMPSSAWTTGASFRCDRCARHVKNAIRISRPMLPPAMNTTTGKMHWRALQNSYCSITCCMEDTLERRDMTRGDILPVLSRMFREVYNVWGAVPPCPYRVEQLPWFSTGPPSDIVEPEVFAKSLLVPTTLPDPSKFEFSYEPSNIVVELIEWGKRSYSIERECAVELKSSSSGNEVSSTNKEVSSNKEISKETNTSKEVSFGKEVSPMKSTSVQKDVSASKEVSSKMSSSIVSTRLVAPPQSAESLRGLEMFYEKEEDT